MESSTVQPATSQLIAGSSVTGSAWKAMEMVPPAFGVSPAAAPPSSPPEPVSPPQPAAAASSSAASSSASSSAGSLPKPRMVRMRGRASMYPSS